MLQWRRCNMILVAVKCYELFVFVVVVVVVAADVVVLLVLLVVPAVVVIVVVAAVTSYVVACVMAFVALHVVTVFILRVARCVYHAVFPLLVYCCCGCCVGNEQ